jgi:hypothetical protein
MDYSNVKKEQLEVCNEYQSEFLETLPLSKLGISKNVKSGILPINGLRILPEGDTNGWYIWAGEELSKNADFFEPLHAFHLNEWVLDIEKYLGLAAGWRFLIAGDYVDVWFDKELIE